MKYVLKPNICFLVVLQCLFPISQIAQFWGSQIDFPSPQRVVCSLRKHKTNKRVLGEHQSSNCMCAVMICCARLSTVQEEGRLAIQLLVSQEPIVGSCDDHFPANFCQLFLKSNYRLLHSWIKTNQFGKFDLIIPILRDDVVPNRFSGLLTLGRNFGSFDFSGMAAMLDTESKKKARLHGT